MASYVEPTDLFSWQPNYEILICRRCRSGVRSSHLLTHLTRRPHTLQHAVAQNLILRTKALWPLLKVAPDDLPEEPPRSILGPIPELQLYRDGKWCRLTSDCLFIGRTMPSLKYHWQTQHGWSPYKHHGRPRQTIVRATEAIIRAKYEDVCCQRFYTRGPGSFFVRVECPPPGREPGTDTVVRQRSQIALDLVQATEEIFQQSQQADETLIQAGEVNEASPWLQRTQWPVYLKGIPGHWLLGLIETPEANAEGTEAVVRLLWDTMFTLACVSQRVTQLTGHSLRIEAARTEVSKRPFQPLKAYMNEARMKQYTEPWQQILAFFARTQDPANRHVLSYEFTTLQRTKWEKLWTTAQIISNGATPDPRTKTPPSDSSDDPFCLTPIQIACHEFCLSLLNETHVKNEYDLTLVCALAVLGRRPSGWKDEDAYPPILSKVIKISRFLVLHRALLLDPQAARILDHYRGLGRTTEFWETQTPLEIPAYPSNHESYDSDSSQSETPSLPVTPVVRRKTERRFREWLTLMMDCFMVRGTFSPLEYMLDLRSYGLKVHYNTTAEGHISWVAYDQLLYKELAFTMGDFRGMIHGLVTSAEQILYDQLLLQDRTTVPKIPWDTLMDDPSQHQTGFSFLQDPRTAWPVDGARWLMTRVVDETALQRRFIDPGQGTFRASTLAWYLRAVVRFLEQLAILIHFTAGQPARAPELLSIRHRNTETGHRNIFIADGLVSFVSRYHKGFYMSNDAKLIHRFVPRPVGTLVVRYLWLVLPFVERLQVHQQHTADQPRTKPATQAALLWGPDPDTQRDWTSERLSRCLRRESAIGLRGQSLNLPAYRNIAIGISRRFLRSSAAFRHNSYEGRDGDWSYEELEDLQDSDDFAGHIADLQAAHSSHVAGMIYGREVTEHAGTTLHQREHFRLSSTDWHRFLGFRSVEDPIRRLVRPPGPDPWENEMSQHRTARRFQLQQANLDLALQGLLGSTTVRFRGIQARALQGIQYGQSPVIAVMPTGGGKSLLFMLPAWIAGGLTVVVVPLVALRSDLQERCTKLGISCVEWQSRRPPDEASIVLVTPEAAVTGDFRTFLNRQQIFGRLDRIVIDECHILLMPGSSFRTTIKLLGQLATWNVQLLLLTATLPPSLEYRLWQHLRVHRDQVHLYRGRTTRPNIAYRIWRPQVDAALHQGTAWLTDSSVMAFVRARISLASPGRTIIYCSTREATERVASSLECEAFHSVSYDKAGILTRFRQGPGQVVVATASLGLGIDIPDIRCVLHLGWPRTMLDYSQESGRAGRDGQASEAVIIQPAGLDQPPFWFQGESGQTEKERAEHNADLNTVQQYLTQSSVCRRTILDEYLDGSEWTDFTGLAPISVRRLSCGRTSAALDPQELRCDICAPDWILTVQRSTLQPDSTSARTIAVVLPPRLPHTSGLESLLDQTSLPLLSSRRRRRSPVSPPAYPRKRYRQSITELPRPTSPHIPQEIPSRTNLATSRASSRGQASYDASEPFIRRPRSPPQLDRTSRLAPSPIAISSPASSSSSSLPSQASYEARSSRAQAPAIPRPSTAIPASSAYDSIPVSVQYEFRRQDLDRTTLGLQWHTPHETSLIDHEFLEDQAHRWKDQCWTCAVQGLDSYHELIVCSNAANHQAREWYRTVRRQIRYAPYMACFRCGMPQSICVSWRTKGGSNPCAFQFVLLPMVAMMVFASFPEPDSSYGIASEIQSAYHQRISQARVPPSEAGGLVQFLGLEASNVAVRQTELVSSFIWLRRAFSSCLV